MQFQIYAGNQVYRSFESKIFKINGRILRQQVQRNIYE